MIDVTNITESLLTKIIRVNCVDVGKRLNMNGSFYIPHALNQKILIGELKQFLSMKGNVQIVRELSHLADEKEIRFCPDILTFTLDQYHVPQYDPILWDMYQYNEYKALRDQGLFGKEEFSTIMKKMQTVDIDDPTAIAQAYHELSKSHSSRAPSQHVSPFVALPMASQDAVQTLLEFSQFVNNEHIFQAILSDDMVTNLALTQGFSGDIQLPSSAGMFLFNIPKLFDPLSGEGAQNLMHLLIYYVIPDDRDEYSVFFALHIIDHDFRIMFSPFVRSFGVDPDTLQYLAHRRLLWK